jgi:hypothetical protein
MKMDFLRILKNILFAVSLGEVVVLGYIAGKTGNNTKMMTAALVLLALNAVIYKLAEKYHKKRGKKDGF